MESSVASNLLSDEFTHYSVVRISEVVSISEDCQPRARPFSQNLTIIMHMSKLIYYETDIGFEIG